MTSKYILNAFINDPQKMKAIDDYINNVVINNKDLTSYQKIAELSKKYIPNGISKGSVDTELSKRNIVKHPTEHYYLKRSDLEKDKSKELLIMMLQEYVNFIVQLDDIPHDIIFPPKTKRTLGNSNQFCFSQLTISTVSGKENLIAEILMDYFELNDEFQMIVGKNCITISSLFEIPFNIDDFINPISDLKKSMTDLQYNHDKKK